MKVFQDIYLNLVKMMNFVLDMVEETLGKLENSVFLYFFIFFTTSLSGLSKLKLGLYRAHY